MTPQREREDQALAAAIARHVARHVADDTDLWPTIHRRIEERQPMRGTEMEHPIPSDECGAASSLSSSRWRSPSAA